MPIEVLIADDQTAHLNRLRSNWETALGKSPRYDTTHDIKQVEEKLQARPHVLIVDNQFENAANDGLDLIARQKAAHPDTIFVLMTAKGFDIDQLGQRTPNPDFIVPKSFLLLDSYLKFIGEAVLGSLKRTTAQVSIPDQGLKEIGISDAAFRSLVEQCLSSLEVLDFDLSSEPSASFQMISGGFSGAAVFQMTVRGAGRSPALPLVFKCGKRSQIDRELKAFERWVRWQLPHDMRVDVIGRGKTGDHAAVCYGFVLGSSKKLVSLADIIRKGDLQTVRSGLERIFFAERTGWYHPVAKAGDTLCKYMLNRVEFSPDKDDRRNGRFRDVLARIGKAEGFDFHHPAGDLIIFGRSYGSVRRVVGSADGGAASLCYCHGDLNANNVFFDAAHNGLALIDFELSGEHHIFRDFVSVETSFRMELPDALTEGFTFEELVGLETARLQKNDAPDPGTYSEWLGLIREQAFKRFPEANQHDYLVPLVLHSWKVLGIKPWSPEGERRLAAAILAGLTLLSKP